VVELAGRLPHFFDPSGPVAGCLAVPAGPLDDELTTNNQQLSWQQFRWQLNCWHLSICTSNYFIIDSLLERLGLFWGQDQPGYFI
jgi:hypothetical protein